MDVMSNPVQNYAWGSRVALAELQQRRAPTPEPEAELWMGAHERASSAVLRDGVELDLAATIAQRPEAELGSEVVESFGPRLPFLLKVLAADEPLSLQVHPDTRQARDPGQGWRDPWGKPEMLCAVTDFEALCGLRSREQALDVLAPLRLPALTDRVGSARGERGICDVVAWLLHASGRALGTMTNQIAREAARAGGVPGPHAAHYRAVARLAESRPADPGVPAALLLHHVRLEPGQALYVAPGTPHSYLGGVGVEIMGNSDNTLRGGLTEKEVRPGDFVETLRPLDNQVIDPVETRPGVDAYPAPAREFRLHRVRVDGSVTVDVPGPKVVFCREGAVRLENGRSCTLEAGRSVFIGAGGGPVTASGEGTLFLAAPGGDGVNGPRNITNR